MLNREPFIIIIFGKNNVRLSLSSLKHQLIFLLALFFFAIPSKIVGKTTSQSSAKTL